MAISHEGMYCLDGALEHLDITPDVYFACVFADLAVDALIDDATLRVGPGTSRAPDRPSWDERLGDLVQEWCTKDADPGERAIVMARAVSSFRTLSDDVAAYLFRVSLDAVPAADLAAMADADALLDRIGDAELERAFAGKRFDSWRRHFVRMLARLPDIGAACPGAIHEAQERRRLRTAAEFAAQARVIEAARAQWRARDTRLDRPPRPPRRERKRVRRALGRAIDLADRLVGRDTVLTLLAGGGAKIEGVRYDYVCERRGSIVQQAADPEAHPQALKVSIHRKGDGERLADGCVYFPATPAIDQLVAIALHVRDREEELALLSEANLLSRTAAYAQEADLRNLPKERSRATGGEFAGLSTIEAWRRLMPGLRDAPDAVVAGIERMSVPGRVKALGYLARRFGPIFGEMRAVPDLSRATPAEIVAIGVPLAIAAVGGPLVGDGVHA
jgi:hypothetical protein